MDWIGLVQIFIEWKQSNYRYSIFEQKLLVSTLKYFELSKIILKIQISFKFLNIFEILDQSHVLIQIRNPNFQIIIWTYRILNNFLKSYFQVFWMIIFSNKETFWKFKYCLKILKSNQVFRTTKQKIRTQMTPFRILYSYFNILLTVS